MHALPRRSTNSQARELAGSLDSWRAVEHSERRAHPRRTACGYGLKERTPRQRSCHVCLTVAARQSHRDPHGASGFELSIVSSSFPLKTDELLRHGSALPLFSDVDVQQPYCGKDAVGLTLYSRWSDVLLTIGAPAGHSQLVS